MKKILLLTFFFIESYPIDNLNIKTKATRVADTIDVLLNWSNFNMTIYPDRFPGSTVVGDLILYINSNTNFTTTYKAWRHRQYRCYLKNSSNRQSIIFLDLNIQSGNTSTRIHHGYTINGSGNNTYNFDILLYSDTIPLAGRYTGHIIFEATTR